MEYGCIGSRLQHSFSTEIHNKLGDYSYELCELQKNELPAFFAARSFKGVNVTIPYKKAVIPFLDDIDPAAAAAGAVNTVINENGKLTGYNTDLYGFQALLQFENISLTGKKAVILGTGGTAKTAACAAYRANASQVLFVSRSPVAPYVSYQEVCARHGDTQIIINTTPVGMYPDCGDTPIDLAPFRELEAVADVIYNPLKTALTLLAAERNVKTANGLFMLVAQAARSSFLFTKVPNALDKVHRIYNDLLKEKKNIVLIGMPGCGKTTIGGMLAKNMGRPFLDTDEMILEKTGMRPAQIITRRGEAALRTAETQVIREIAGRTGCVIATGGGAVLNKNNVDFLKMNGTAVFLDRDPALLRPSPDRPLSSDKELLMKRYIERIGIYKSAADITVRANGTAQETAAEIERRFLQ